jgi:hypothetical protein
MPFIKLRGKTYDLDAPLRGAKAIAEVRGTSEREAFYAAEAGKYALAEQLNIPVAFGADNEPKDIARLKRIIKTWIKNKVLAIEEHTDEQRKKKRYIIPGSFKPEEPAGADDEADLDE